MMRLLRSRLRLLVMGAWYSYRALFYWFTPVAYVSSKIIYPLFTLFLFVFMGRFAGLRDEMYIVVGNILMLTALNSLFGVTMTVGNERDFRTLPYVLGSPAPRVPLFLGRALVNVLDGVLTVVAAIGIGQLLFGLDLSRANLPLAALCVLLISLTSSGLGLMLGSIALLTREGWTISSAVYLALFLLCGVNFPVEALPLPLQTVAYALPLTRGIAATRQVIAGADLASVAPQLGSEILIGLIYAAIAYVTFRRIEKRSLASGQLDTV